MVSYAVNWVIKLPGYGAFALYSTYFNRHLSEDKGVWFLVIAISLKLKAATHLKWYSIDFFSFLTIVFASCRVTMIILTFILFNMLTEFYKTFYNIYCNSESSFNSLVEICYWKMSCHSSIALVNQYYCM